jgi:hypothetical protein
MKHLLKAAVVVASISVSIFVAEIFLPPPAFAQVPQKINYQGFLTDAAKVPISVSLQLTFALYDVPTGGTALWFETQQVAVNNGVFNVLLGTATPIPLPFDVQYYLGITVGTDPQMTPRQPLASAPYALKAGCNPGDRMTCFTGTSGTPGVGLCVTGIRTCNAAGTAWSACAGEVTPNCGANCVNLQTDPTNCGACGVVCSGGLTCGGGGVPGQCGATGSCSAASQCPGVDTECSVRTCSGGACGVSNVPAGTATASQVAGDCRKNACDGAGGITNVIDNADIPPPIPCTVSHCTAGVPSNAIVADGTSCSDGNACTVSDACSAGACVGVAVTCSALDQCHNLGACNPATGVCSNPNKANGTACDDGTACTVSDACSAGACVGASAADGTVCSDGGGTSCHAGTCQ